VNILVDTQIYLWSLMRTQRISSSISAHLANDANVFFASQASLWEIQIKSDLDKLVLPLPLREFVLAAQTTARFQILPIQNEAIYHLGRLPHIHRDPFDRLIIAHAMFNGWPLATADAEMRKYPVRLLD
jgi:PIN domain nuclease of toxin-antitoxin system